MSVAQKSQRVYQVAQHLYSKSPHWATFHREVLGVDGIARRLFPTLEAMEAFEQTEEYQNIQRMLAELRTTGPLPPKVEEPTCVVTVRLPKSLHEALRIEAYERMTSMNKLCISKLLQFIEAEMVPTEMPELGPGRSGNGARRRPAFPSPRFSAAGNEEDGEEVESEADL
jgi:predicted HicB family RNase H-like nuclease